MISSTGTEKKLYHQAWKRWGPASQLTQLSEECAEVIQAVCKILNYPKEDRLEQLAEELADASLVMEQVTYCLGLEERINVWRERKKAKLESLLNASRQRLSAASCGRKHD